MPENNLSFPDDRGYTKEHIWARPDGGEFVIGISDFAQDQLTEILFVDCPEPGEHLDIGGVFGNIESLKTVSDLFTPFAGTVTHVNEAIGETPTLVNDDPYGDGWIIKMRADNPDEAKGLLTADNYAKLIKH